MKIALIQLNPIVGDVLGNSKKIINFIAKAKKSGANLVVFPEMTILGYPPRDLLEMPSLIEKSIAAINNIAAQVEGIAAVIGGVSLNDQSKGRPLFNSAYFIEEQKIKVTAHKSLLPFYDVFDESRYFEPGSERTVIDFMGKKIGLTICEDIWTQDFLKRPYSVNVLDDLKQKGAEIVINISASPYSLGKQETREEMLSEISKKFGMQIIYVNQVGGNDELIFDGGSMLVDGEVKVRAPFFREGMTLVGLDESNSPQPRISSSANDPHILRGGNLNLNLLGEALICGLKDYVRKCGFKKVTLGISGGIDSALVATLAVKALGKENVTGIFMPSRYTSKESKTDSVALAKNLGFKLKIIPIDSVHKVYEKIFKKMFGNKKADTTEENVQARIRGNYLMALSNKEGFLVLSTGNKSELSVGYCTLYGDMSGGLSVISDLPKTLVYSLAKYLSGKKKLIPENIFIRPPTAELKFNQTDQDSLPPYDILDGILKLSIEEMKSEEEIISQGYDSKTVRKVLGMISRNEYKRRQAAPGLKVTSKAFGMGRRFPIACKV